jgi:hypothetical protein
MSTLNKIDDMTPQQKSDVLNCFIGTLNATMRNDAATPKQRESAKQAKKDLEDCVKIILARP